MKARFDPRDFAGATPRYGVCLLYGTDADLIEDRSAEVTRLVAGSLDDPFRVATLGLDAHAALAAEVSARALTGGRRAVRVRDCGERLLPALEKVVKAGTGDTALLLLAGALTRKSKLRGWAEQSDRVAAVACNTDDAAQRRGFVEQALTAAGLRADADVRGMLLDRLPPGRRGILADVEKLALLSGDAGTVEWDDASALLNGDGSDAVHAAIDAALAGHAATALTQWERAFEAGTNGVGFVRMLGVELGRLGALLGEVERGAPVSEALQAQRFYPRDPRTRLWAGLVQRWDSRDMLAGLMQVHEAERACKTTGTDDRLAISRLLSGIASLGRRRPGAR